MQDEIRDSQQEPAVLGAKPEDLSTAEGVRLPSGDAQALGNEDPQPFNAPITGKTNVPLREATASSADAVAPHVNDDAASPTDAGNPAQDSAEAAQPKKRIDVVKLLREIVQTMLIAAVIVLLLRVFVFELAVVDGPSMQPTLETGERVLVMKWTQYLRPMPRHGEIMVTRYPEPEFEGYFIKRVVGVAGDRVCIKQGIVYVNDEPNTTGTGLCLGDMEELEVPEHHVFVMGDNRPWSMDSRDPRIGTLDIDMLLGRADVLIFPMSRMKIINHATD